VKASGEFVACEIRIMSVGPMMLLKPSSNTGRFPIPGMRVKIPIGLPVFWIVLQSRRQSSAFALPLCRSRLRIVFSQSRPISAGGGSESPQDNLAAEQTSWNILINNRPHLRCRARR